MGWYVLHCRLGREQMIVNSCRQHLSGHVMEKAFIFQCERLWRVDGEWRRVTKKMFPGYIFLQSSHPGILSDALDEYRSILRVMETERDLIPVYKEEEEYLQRLCGADHLLKMSYGYKERDAGVSRITEGPLRGLQDYIIKIDWHRRFAKLEVQLSRKRALVWAGLDISCGTLMDEKGYDVDTSEKLALDLEDESMKV